MKTHLKWIRVTAAVVVAGVSVQQATAQYAPYRPLPPQTPAATASVPVVGAAQPVPQQATPVYTAYRTPTPTTPAYGSPTGSQYAQPSAAYPQYPQTTSQYPATYGSYPYVAQQSADTMPAPKNMNQPVPPPSPTPANGMPSNGMSGNGMSAAGKMPTENMSAAQPGGCNCVAPYGAGDYYNAQGCGCTAAGYPNCGISNYFGEEGCSENQWFGGVYFLEMGRTNTTPVKLTSEIPGGTAYPYYPLNSDTVMSSRDVNFDFREGVEVRVGSTFTIGEPCNTCQSPCGYNTGCGCNSGKPATTYAWEVAWWGLNDSPNQATVVYDTDRLVGMKNYAGLMYNGNPVNNYYGYGIPVDVLGANPQVLAQRVRTDFKAQNLELNVIRFPVCDTCATASCGCNGGCGGCDSCDSGLGFSMYGSCGVRYFHFNDDFMYADEYNPNGGAHTYDGFGSGDIYELYHDIQVENNLVGPQVGWTTDYCWGRWSLFCNSTFGIFNNHMSVMQRMFDGTGDYATFASDGSNYNITSHKDAVAFLGELRVGTAYDISCHWRAVIAYRALALTGVATASDQLHEEYTNRYDTAIIDSDNAVIIHGAQVGAECRY